MGLIISALAVFAGGLGFFHALVTVLKLTCVPVNDPNMAMVSPEMDLLLIIVCFAAAWILGYFQKGTFAFRSIGTKFYGHKETGQGYIATKWLTAIIPLLPIRSYVIHYRIREISAAELEVQENEMDPFEGYFYLPQMLRTAIISYGMVIWCLGCLWLIFAAHCF
jgi:hypothetical protein